MAPDEADREDWDRREWRPNPDPTRLTTAQLEAAIEILRRELSTALETVRRESGMQVTQIQQYIEQVDKMSEVRHDRLKELWQESHSGFKTLVEQASIYNAQARETAEVAHEKAISKAEVGASAQIGDVKSRLDLVAKNLEQKIEAIDNTMQKLNDRVTGMEARGLGLSESRGWASQQTTHILSIVAIVASIGLYLVSILTRPPPTPTPTFQPAPSYGTQNVNPPQSR